MTHILKLIDYNRKGGNFEHVSKVPLHELKGRAFIDAWDEEWNLKPIEVKER